MIISLICQKGGVGKSTLSTSIAHQLSRSGKNRVLLIDADPQQSTLTWHESRNKDLPCPFSVSGFAKKSIESAVKDLSRGYDYVVIDSPPRLDLVARGCMMASDFILVPCTPSAYDFWACSDTVKLIKEAALFKKGLMGSFVINQKKPNMVMGRDVVFALQDLKFPVLNTHIFHRAAFINATASGLTIFEYDENGKSANEIISVTSEILNFTQGVEVHDED